MSGKTAVPVDCNVKVTNYKPAKGREQQDGDVNITNKDGQIKVPKNYENLFNKVKALDGDSTTLSWSDGELAKSLAGTDGISAVRMDSTAKVVTFVLDDLSVVRIDMGINENKTIKSIQEEINTGNAEYADGVLHYLLQCFTPHTPKKGAEIVLNELPDDCKTLGDVKAKYNLPDGCLINNVMQGGGNLDEYEAVAPIYIHVETLAKKLGITPEQIEDLFNQK